MWHLLVVSHPHRKACNRLCIECIPPSKRRPPFLKSSRVVTQIRTDLKAFLGSQGKLANTRKCQAAGGHCEGKVFTFDKYRKEEEEEDEEGEVVAVKLTAVKVEDGKEQAKGSSFASTSMSTAPASISTSTTSSDSKGKGKGRSCLSQPERSFESHWSPSTDSSSRPSSSSTFAPPTSYDQKPLFRAPDHAYFPPSSSSTPIPHSSFDELFLFNRSFSYPTDHASQPFYPSENLLRRLHSTPNFDNPRAVLPSGSQSERWGSFYPLEPTSTAPVERLIPTRNALSE